MEIGNGGASSKGGLIPVPDSSDVFKNSVLAPLQSAYLYDESRQFFRYKSAVLVKNPTLERKYNAFRTKRREAGYSEEDLEESYGFLLFDDVNKANALGETGVLAGNSTCTTLGDPSKGVYISMYSDCLDLNRWYHGKSGYIAIIRLTKGKVKKVSENYTQNFTAPTVGFDCHVSEQLPSVSAQTSSFLAFERTQCYMYELLDDASNATAQSPSAACPFAILSFSYTDTKATIAPPQEKCDEKKAVFHYLPWRGQLEIGSQLYNIGLRSTTGALIPAKLPPVVKVDRAISMLDLRQLLPKAVFETCFAGEAFLDGLYCSLCELVSTEAEETNSLAQLVWKIREKDLALAVLLSDGGFLILLHSSHFLTYDDAWSCATEVLQGLFVFPDSRVVMKDTKFGEKKPSVTSEILQILPVLSYAEGEVEKTSINPSEELCEVLAQHMQSYTALINPGLASSPSREVSMFPFQYDVPDAHLYSSPEWTDRAVQSFRSYLSRPVSFQLPVSRASEILAAGQEERRREDLDDDVYICISSPEEAPQEMIDPVTTVLEETLSDLNSPETVETSVENGRSSPGAQDLTVVPRNVVTNDLQPGHLTKGNEKCRNLSELNKTEGVNNVTPPTSDDLPAELIVSITSAEQSVSDETLNLRAKLQAAEVNSLCDETDYTKKLLDIPRVTSFTGTKLKMRTRLSKGSNKVSKASVEPSSLQTVKTPVEVDSVNSQKDEHTKDLSDHPQLRNPSNWRKLQRRKRRCGKLSTKSRKLRSGIVPLPIAEEKKTDPGLQNVEGTILVELEVCTLRRKTERWDLKPIISECGRILVPHGATDFTDQIKFLKDKLQATKDEQSPEKILIDAPVDADDTVELDPESCTAPETTVEEMEAAESVDGGNDLQNITASDVNPEQNISKQLDVVNSLLPLNPESNSSKNEHTDTLPSQAFQEKHSDNLSPEKSPTKCEFLLRKLKSVLLKGKRKVDLVTGDTTPNTLQDTEPCLKKSKEVDSETEVLKSNDTNTLSTDAAVKEVPKMLPVDPLFAFALGLTPKVIPEKVTKTEDRDTPQKMDPTKTQEQMISDKQSHIIHRPPSIFTRRGRIKTLKKHQSVSAECIKKKWWLHFQTPACIASEKLKYKDSTSDNSVRKTEKTVNSAYSSADALNLLADLALSANNDQVPPQPKPSFERKPETSLKKSDLKKELTSAEQESVLHALLRQPAPRATEPHESPAPSHLVCELVGLVSKEHAYSLPPSSSLLLGLPGTSPVSDSPGLLHHDQPMYGIKTLQPTVDQQDRSEHNRTPEYLRKRMVRKQKFRYSRTFVNKEGSIKVTRHWQENYDFNLDSKFTSDSKDKTIIRALHGPWDFSIQDTNEEVRLIVHMWIGLFYSRSTPRFFHVEPNFSYLSLEESDSLEMVPSPARSEHLATALASVRSVTDTSDPLISTAWDLSKKDEDQDSVVLDLSLRNSSACSESLTSSLQVNKKGTFDSSEQKEPSETLNSVKLPRQLYEHSGKMVNSKENLTDMINVKKNHEGEKTNAPRKTFCLQSTDIPSFEDDGKVIPLQKVTDSASIKPNAPLAALGIGQVLHGCNEEKTNKKEGTENSGPKERSLVKQDIMDSFKFVKHEKNIEAEDVVQTDEHEKNKSKKLAICERKEDPCQKGNADPSQNVARAADDSAKESDIFCNGNCLESEKLLSRQEHKAVSQEQHESFKGVLVCGPKYKGKLMKDEHLRKDRLDEKDDCISALKADKDLAHQPLPEKCNGPDLVNQNFITQSNHQAQMNEQPSLTNNTKDACHDLLDAKMLCSDALVQDYSVSEKVSHTPFGIKSVNTESATKDISKKAIYLRNEALKTAVFRLSTPQTKDNVEMKSQNKERSDFSTAQSDYEDQDNKSAEEMLKDEKEQFQHQPNSPHCELLKACEAQVTFTKETDLRTDETNEGLDKNCTGVEIPFTGIDSPGEDTVQIKDYNAADEQFQHQPHSPQCNVPKICEAQLAFTEKTDVIIDKTNEGLDKCCTGVEIPFVGIDDSGEDTVQAKDDNATHKKPFQHQSHSPQHEFPKIFEAQVTSTKETDLRTDETNEGLDKNCTGVEIPFTGIDGSGGDTVQVKDYSATDEQFQHQPHSPQCNVPKICEAQLAFTEKTDVIIDKTNEGLDKCCTGVEIPFVGIEGSGGDTVQVKDYSATDEEQFQHQPHLLQSEVPKIFEAEVTSTKEPDLRTDETNEGLDKSCTGVEIPLIGIKSSGEDTVQPHGSLPHDRGEEVVQSQEEIPFISDSSDTKSALPDEVHSTSQECSKQALPCKILLVDVNERYRPVDLGNESDDRCPTPTIDEKPYGCLPRSSPNSSTSAFSGTETAKNLNHKSPSTISAPVNGELPCEQKICHTSIFNTDSSPHQVFHPDLEVRTLRVLQSIDKFLSISNYTDKSCQIQTPKMKESVDQSPNPSSKCIPSSLSFKDEKIGNNKPAVVPASVSQDLHKESSEHLLVSPFKNKLEEVLGVKLHLKKTDSAPQNYFERVNIQENSVGQDSHSYSPPSTELLQVIKPSLETERPKSTSQSSHEPRPFSHRPVMAVKPSKNDESQADFFSIDVHTEKPLKSKPPKTPRLAYNVPKSMLSERRTKEKSRRHSERLDDDQEACQLSFKNTWLPDVDNSKSNSVEAKFGLLDLSYQCQRKNISKFNTIPSSSPSVQSSESAESSSKIVDGVQCFLINGSVEKDEQTVKKNIEMDLKDSSSASASFMSQRDDDSIDESLILGPQSSLVCTVYNNSRKRPYSFLEQVSQRCLQDDLTQASVEQECLVFSEQMKQVLKKSERWSIHQEDIHDNIRPSCSSPMTINFSNLDEQEDSLDQLGTSLIGQKIKVDLSNRNDPTDKTEEDMLHPEEQSQGKDNSVEHDWVSDVTAECARLYEAKMHHVCAFKNVSSRAKHFRKNYTKTEPSNHFDFCDQMKKEMDKTFRTNLNSVVKKSCRTKYRFYILATSDDVFFEQTKAQLEAEGHTAIQPSDFFLGEDSSSSSIIIIRNEDIAEHICKVPHLLELKKSLSVQFAGIDEPDDVVNLTHQELFTQGGFIMFSRSTLDALSLCKMKKVSEILLELSKMGKWKWMLHYRDSRRIKENARLSAEAKEKKHFVYWGQDAGLLEVLPYHECDQMSKDQPDYLACLIRLQVQKISSRYPVFITDAAMDSGFEKNGILTMTSNSFLTKPLSEMFTV